MHSFYLIALFPVAAFATLYGHCSGTATGDYLSDGICDYTSDCKARSGSHISGGCPYDDNDITCCLIGLEGSIETNPCGVLSYCDWTANTDCKSIHQGSFKAGKWYHCLDSRYLMDEKLGVDVLLPTGYCPGGSNYECCKFT